MHISRLLSRRSTVAALSAATLVALALPAGATTTTTPAHGSATSSLTVLKLRLEGQSVSAGSIVARVANAKSPHTAQLVVTPLAYNFPLVGKSGTIGRQTITPSSPTTVPATPRSVSLPAGLGKVTGPTFVVQAKDGATGVLATARLKALGAVTIATVPVSLNAATLEDTASVTASRASAVKSVSLGNLALPNLLGLLSSLGLDVSKLTQDQLTALAGVVGTVSSAITTLNTTIDTLQTQVTGAPDTVATAQTAVTSALAALQAQLDTLNTALATPATLAAFTTALSGAGFTVPTLPLTADSYRALPTAEQTTIATFSDTTLATTIATANTAVDQAQQLLADLQSLLTQVQNVLDGAPLASLGGISVTTKAIASKTPTANAAVKVATVDVLGAAAPLSQLTSTLSSVTNQLASVLNSIAGVSFTPPSITVGTPSKSTKTVGRTRYAKAGITAVKLTLPSLTLPAALRLSGAPVQGVSGSLVLGELVESAQWTPAVTHTSTPTAGGGPQLGKTGGDVALPILAVLCIGAAAVLRRRWGTPSIDG